MLLLCFVSSARAVAHEFDRLPWLVKVSSTYRDSGKGGGSTTFTGYGFVIEAVGKKYVVTASHLSQGGVADKKPTLSIEAYVPGSQTSFRPVSFTNRMAFNELDIEAIELAPGELIPALARMASDRNWPDRYSFVLLPEWQKALEPAQAGPGQVEGFTSIGLRSMIPATELLTPGIVSPLKSLASREQLQDLPFQTQKQGEMGFETMSHEIVSFVPGHPGMSGLPLIYLSSGPVNYELLKGSDIREWKIAGAFSAGSRTFSKSWFSKLWLLANEFYLWLDPPIGEPRLPPKSELQWYCRDGLLHRVGMIRGRIGDADKRIRFEEATFQGESPIPAQRKVFGNGRRVDGNGRRSDSGQGSSPTPSAFVDDGLVFEIRPKQSKLWSYWPWSNRADTSPASPAAALFLDWKILPADTTNALFALQEAVHNGGGSGPGKLKPIHPAGLSEQLKGDGFEGSFAQLLWNRWTGEFTGYPEKGYAPDGSLPARFEGRDLNAADPFALVTATVTVGWDPKSDRLRARIDLGEDILEFELGSQGELIGSSPGAGFQPEITVRGSRSSASYQVELAGLLMDSMDAVSSYGLGDHPSLNIRRFLIRGSDRELLLYGICPRGSK